MSHNLTDHEKELVRNLYDQFDIDQSGFIDAHSARHSSKMLELVHGLERHTRHEEGAKIYIEDLMEFYEEFKQKKIDEGRDPKEEVCTSFIEMMIKRVDHIHRRQSFRMLTPSTDKSSREFESIHEDEEKEISRPQ